MSNLERPGNVVYLPSKGMPYGSALPDGEVQVTTMKTVDEKMLAGISKRLDFETAIDALIKRCTSVPFKPEELYIGDRTFLMMQIRAASYGALYSFKVTCPDVACRASWDNEIDLTKDLDVREVDESWEDPFKVDLPVSKDVVTLRLFSGRDEREVVQYVERQNRKVNIKVIGDPGYIFRMALHMVAVESSSNPEASFDAEACSDKPGRLMMLATHYCEALAAADSSEINSAIDSRTPGLILAVRDVVCPKCPNVFDIALPLTPDFFRSKSSSGTHTKSRMVSV